MTVQSNFLWPLSKKTKGSQNKQKRILLHFVVNVKKANRRLPWSPESPDPDRGLWFWVPFNALGLCWFLSWTWLWSTVPVASDQTRNRKTFSLTEPVSWCLASLILNLSVCSNPEPTRTNVGVCSPLWYRCCIWGFPLEASLWWDQAMFGHECGFWVERGEWKAHWRRLNNLRMMGWTDLARLQRPTQLSRCTLRFGQGRGAALEKPPTMCMSVIWAIMQILRPHAG